MKLVNNIKSRVLSKDQELVSRYCFAFIFFSSLGVVAILLSILSYYLDLVWALFLFGLLVYVFLTISFYNMIAIGAIFNGPKESYLRRKKLQQKFFVAGWSLMTCFYVAMIYYFISWEEIMYLL